jgi:WD40 repeat protein
VTYHESTRGEPRIVTGGTDHDLIVWNERGERLRTLRGHTQAVVSEEWFSWGR